MTATSTAAPADRAGAARHAPAAPAVARTPLWRLTAVELRKMVDTRSGRWLLAVIGLLATVAVGILMFTGNADDRNLARSSRSRCYRSICSCRCSRSSW